MALPSFVFSSVQVLWSTLDKDVYEQSEICGTCAQALICTVKKKTKTNQLFQLKIVGVWAALKFDFLDLKTTNRGNVLVSQSLQDLFKVKTTGLFLQFCSLVFWKYLNRTHVCVRKLKLGVDNRFRQVINPFNPPF